eukprot:CAMPEP_0175305260 /NCGR_PEP_ID=MMETSP0093-20121207/63655_1 /TAXON_ID=311494 /ORGANISM="Alexandrium monilatum, Strain CCMP3105" /LENGTH=142 /DNA_ID=CAMNT_0016601687 /DNA_START=84 /DNA_END=512 /DNA_ORIENTATION=+
MQDECEAGCDGFGKPPLPSTTTTTTNAALLQRCLQRCSDLQYCCDQLPFSTHGRPSCAMGCIMAAHDLDAASCRGHCAKAVGCNYKHPLVPQTFHMCVGHETCSKTCVRFEDCRQCYGHAFTMQDECEAGCDSYGAAGILAP